MRDTLKKKRNETKGEEGERERETGGRKEGGGDIRVRLPCPTRFKKKKKKKSPRESGLYIRIAFPPLLYIYPPPPWTPESNKSLSYLRQGN